jgi:hypothetical protein
MSEPKSTAPQGDGAAAGRRVDAIDPKLASLVLLFFAWRFVSHLPPPLSAELLQGLVIAAMGAVITSLIVGLLADMRGKDGMGKLETVGTWVAEVLAFLIAAGLIYGLFTVVDYVAGPAIGAALRGLINLLGFGS